VSDVETYLPIDDLAATLSVKVNTIRTWVRQGFIPKNTYIKVSNTYRFNIPQVIDALRAGKDLEDLEEYVDEVTNVPKESISDLVYEVTSAPQERSLDTELDLDENEDF